MRFNGVGDEVGASGGGGGRGRERSGNSRSSSEHEIPRRYRFYRSCDSGGGTEEEAPRKDQRLQSRASISIRQLKQLALQVRSTCNPLVVAAAPPPWRVCTPPVRDRARCVARCSRSAAAAVPPSPATAGGVAPCVRNLCAESDEHVAARAPC